MGTIPVYPVKGKSSSEIYIGNGSLWRKYSGAMEIRRIRESDIESLIEFNSRIYSEKEIDIEKYIRFWLSKSDDEERSLIIINDDGEVVGQNFFSTMSYYLDGLLVDSVWGFDLIVDEAYRKMNWGVDLLLACKASEPKSFATGSGPDALQMNLKLGQKLLGWIRKYVGIINPLWIPFAICGKQKCTADFPNIIETDSSTYTKLADASLLPDNHLPYNRQLLEISRDKQFLTWRYYNELHEYAFYYDSVTGNWLVLRTTVIKHITVLLLVDWRCKVDNQQEFENIYQVTKIVANKIRVPLFITGSSLSVFDKVLESHRLKSVGRPRPVIGRIKVKNYQEEIDNRNFIYATLGDSDGETNWR